MLPFSLPTSSIYGIHFFLGLHFIGIRFKFIQIRFLYQLISFLFWYFIHYWLVFENSSNLFATIYVILSFQLFSLNTVIVRLWFFYDVQFSLAYIASVIIVLYNFTFVSRISSLLPRILFNTQYNSFDFFARFVDYK